MAGIFEPGRVCIVTKGADAGKEVVVKEVIDANFVKIAGEQVKERRANVAHLEPTSKVAASVPEGKKVIPREKKPQTAAPAQAPVAAEQKRGLFRRKPEAKPEQKE
jgi:ribosomal protein L14E/L6E/L27E